CLRSARWRWPPGCTWPFGVHTLTGAGAGSGRVGRHSGTLAQATTKPPEHNGDMNDARHACACCGYRTLPAKGDYELCPVCFWEDDGQSDDDADEVYGGPNGSLSLTQARSNFAAFGACDREFIENVRPPLPEERAAGP